MREYKRRDYGSESHSEDTPIMMRGNWEDLKGNACIYVRCGEFENNYRRGVAYRSAFNPRAVFTRFALDFLEEPRSRPIATAGDLKGDCDLYYAGRFPNPDLCDYRVAMALENYQQEIQYQIEERIACAAQAPIIYSSVTPELIQDVMFLNFVKPLAEAHKTKREGLARQVETAFRVFGKSYPHPQDIGELCAAMKRGNAELAGSYFNKIISIKTENYGITADVHKRIIQLKKAS